MKYEKAACIKSIIRQLLNGEDFEKQLLHLDEITSREKVQNYFADVAETVIAKKPISPSQYGRDLPDSIHALANKLSELDNANPEIEIAIKINKATLH